MKQIRKRLTYSNVLSSLAIFLVLGGATAFAAVQKIGANEIKANAIKTGKIVKEAVTSGKIKKGAITETKIADGAVTTNKLADNAVTTAKIANDAVTGDKVKESTLGEVPKATTATTAANATGLAGPLAPGQTLTGQLGSGGHKQAEADFIDEGWISFPIRLASVPSANFVGVGGPPTANCPGSSANPTAAPGKLCVYAYSFTGGTGLNIGPTKFGASFFITGLSAAPVNYELQAVWAVTAP